MKDRIKRKILILCGDATYNRGDRGNLASQIDLLKEHFPDYEIVCDSYLPERDAKWYAIHIIPRGIKAFWIQLKEIITADVVVWGGGALLTDNASCIKIPYWCFRILFIKLILRKKVMAWAHGIIVQTSLGALFARWVLNAVDIITVRDQNSFDNVRQIGIPHERIFLTADPAVLLKPASKEIGKEIIKSQGIPLEEGRPIISIPISFCSFHYNPGALIPHMYAVSLGIKKEWDSPLIKTLVCNLAEFCDHLVETYNASVLLIPTYVAPWEKDEFYLHEVRKKTKNTKDIYVFQGDEYEPKKYVSMFYYFSLVISVPMHHNFFSLVTGRPCINLYYEPKGKDFYEALGAKEWMFPIHDFCKSGGVEKLKQKVAHLHQSTSSWPEILSRFEKLKKQANLNIVHLKQLIK